MGAWRLGVALEEKSSARLVQGLENLVVEVDVDIFDII